MVAICILVHMLCTMSVHAQISVSPSQTAQALCQRLAGQGVNISNATLTCPALANGFFSAPSADLGLDSGILLTTGRAATAGSSFGVNGISADLASNDNSASGDSDLNALAHQSTFDACSLAFDLIPSGDTISFSYVFSSEEYKNAVCGPYNDAFAFFISGPGIAGAENMALVPGSTIPVTINSINNGRPGSTGNIANCTSMGTGSPFTAYYIDNSSGTTLTHQGLTTILQATHAVTSCSRYHLKLAIADAGDPLYDSGVFLEAGSLQTNSYNITSPPVPVHDTAYPFCVKGCLPGHFTIKRSLTRMQPQTIKYITAGDALSGIDYATLPDSIVIPANSASSDITVYGLPTAPDGTKTLKLYILSPFACATTNNIIDSASLLIYDTLQATITSPDTMICGNDSVRIRATGNTLATYIWSPPYALDSANVTVPLATPATSTTYTLTVSLPGTACPAKTAAITISIKNTPAILLASDTTACFNATVQLNAAVTPANIFYTYQWIGPNGYTSTTLSASINNITAQEQGYYTLTVTNDSNACKSKAAILLNVNTPDTPSVAAPVIECLNSPAHALKAKGDSLLWYNASIDTATNEPPIPSTNELATYTYYVAQVINGCESPKTQINVEVKKCCDGIISIPTAFTPDGDGINDRFSPIMAYGYTIEKIVIVNRFGQVVFSDTQGSWDGRFNGSAADIGTYFYAMRFGCILGGTVDRKGDVTVIR